MLEKTVLDDLRIHLMNRIAYAGYTVGSMNETAPIEKAAILEDGRVSIEFVIGGALGSGEMVTEVRLYDASDVLLARKPENITRDLGLGGIYYRFYFRIEEVM